MSASEATTSTSHDNDATVEHSHGATVVTGPERDRTVGSDGDDVHLRAPRVDPIHLGRFTVDQHFGDDGVDRSEHELYFEASGE